MRGRSEAHVKRKAVAKVEESRKVQQHVRKVAVQASSAFKVYYPQPPLRTAPARVPVMLCDPTLPLPIHMYAYMVYGLGTTNV